MSAWYVFSALGMYPETPGTADLALGSPLFTQAVIKLPSGNTFTVNAPAAADNAPYVQSATWNGAAWNNAYVPDRRDHLGRHAELHARHHGQHVVGQREFRRPAVVPGHRGRAADHAPDVRHRGQVRGRHRLRHRRRHECAADGLPRNNAQRWYHGADDTVQSLGGCLDVSNSGTTDGTKVQYWECNNSGAQKWTESGGALVNPQSGKCLDDPNSSTTNGTQLQIYTCNGSPAQKWSLSG